MGHYRNRPEEMASKFATSLKSFTVSNLTFHPQRRTLLGQLKINRALPGVDELVVPGGFFQMARHTRHTHRDTSSASRGTLASSILLYVLKELQSLFSPYQ